PFRDSATTPAPPCSATFPSIRHRGRAASAATAARAPGEPSTPQTRSPHRPDGCTTRWQRCPRGGDAPGKRVSKEGEEMPDDALMRWETEGGAPAGAMNGDAANDRRREGPGRKTQLRPERRAGMSSEADVPFDCLR